MSYFIEAKQKIEREIASAEKIGRYTPMTTKPTAEALINFCEQNEEFAESVVKGGSFYDCMKTCDSSTNGPISDFDYFSKAVAFYISDAKIEVTMNVRINAKNDCKIISLNLSDFI